LADTIILFGANFKLRNECSKMTIDKSLILMYEIEHNQNDSLQIELFLNFIGREVTRSSIGG
jgi:hypothetical protein